MIWQRRFTYVKNVVLFSREWAKSRAARIAAIPISVLQIPKKQNNISKPELSLKAAQCYVLTAPPYLICEKLI